MSGLVKTIIRLFPGLLMLMTASCGGGGNHSPMPQGPSGTPVSVTFVNGTPAAAATRFGTSSFTAATLNGNSLSFTVPAGTSNFTIAYVCVSANGNVTEEFVLQASVQDSTSINRACPAIPNLRQLGAATGGVDATAIAGATSVTVFALGRSSSIAALGSFSVSLPVGTADVAFAALDANSNVIALKILRSQTIPGPINNGNTVIFGSSDMTPKQTFTFTGVLGGFLAGQDVIYETANGTFVTLGFQSVNGVESYATVPPSAVQSGDFYLFDGFTSNLPNSGPVVEATEIVQVTTTAEPITLTAPRIFVFFGPTPAPLPAFDFTYPGFPSGLSSGVQQARISWSPTMTTTNAITITATPSFQNGTTSLSIPDLTSLAGFLAPAPSGTKVSWIAEIFASSGQPFPAVLIPDKPGLGALVQNAGSYTEP